MRTRSVLPGATVNVTTLSAAAAGAVLTSSSTATPSRAAFPAATAARPISGGTPGKLTPPTTSTGGGSAYTGVQNETKLANTKDFSRCISCSLLITVDASDALLELRFRR